MNSLFMIMDWMMFNKSKLTLAEAEMLLMVHLFVQVSVLDGTSTPPLKDQFHKSGLILKPFLSSNTKVNSVP